MKKHLVKEFREQLGKNHLFQEYDETGKGPGRNIFSQNFWKNSGKITVSKNMMKQEKGFEETFVRQNFESKCWEKLNSFQGHGETG